MPFVEALRQAGLEEQDAERGVYVIDQPITVSEGEAMLAALPGDSDGLDILFDLDYSAHPSIGRQVLRFRLERDDYARPDRPRADLPAGAGGRGAAGPRLRHAPDAERDILVMDERRARWTTSCGSPTSTCGTRSAT